MVTFLSLGRHRWRHESLRFGPASQHQLAYAEVPTLEGQPHVYSYVLTKLRLSESSQQTGVWTHINMQRARCYSV